MSSHTWIIPCGIDCLCRDGRLVFSFYTIYIEDSRPFQFRFCNQVIQDRSVQRPKHMSLAYMSWVIIPQECSHEPWFFIGYKRTATSINLYTPCYIVVMGLLGSPFTCFIVHITLIMVKGILNFPIFKVSIRIIRLCVRLLLVILLVI